MSKQPNRLNVSRLYWGTAIVLFVAYAGFVLLLWRVGVFDFPETDPAAEVLAAVIGLLGALFAAILTFAGVLLKHSVDERNLQLKEEAEKRLTLEGDRNLQLKEEAERRLTLEGDRNLQLKEEAERRLTLEGERNLALKGDAEKRPRLETFIHSAGLMATAAGAPTPKTQQAGALFALAELGQLEFALALLREMWPAGAVSPTSACWLIDKCLRSNDEKLQEEAAGILEENAETLTTAAECFDWPPVIESGWPAKLSVTAGEAILRAVSLFLRSRPVEDWDESCLNGVIVNLVETRSKDKDGRVRSAATLLLNVLLKNLGAKEGDFLILSGGGGHFM